ncbi:MAG TPA: STAS domain-containing protein [Phycisphaerae bacterium]|nr:STAS domain-containing protein [Phycisphaerae bacterium]
MATRSMTETPFTVDVQRRGDCAIVALGGSCTMNESDRLTQCMVKLAGEGVRLIVVDMSKLDFIESTGLGAIIAGHLRVRRHQGEVRLVSPMPAIYHLLELTRLTQLFTIYKSAEEACR